MRTHKTTFPLFACPSSGLFPLCPLWIPSFPRPLHLLNFSPKLRDLQAVKRPGVQTIPTIDFAPTLRLPIVFFHQILSVR